jgi:hypothetical protein
MEFLDKLKKGKSVTLYLRNGEIWSGIFQFLDGDSHNMGSEIVLKSHNPNAKGMLGWQIGWVSRITIDN